MKGATAIVEAADVVPMFTGTGFARLSRAGDQVVWWVTIPPRTINYTAIIRYRVCALVFGPCSRFTFVSDLFCLSGI